MSYMLQHKFETIITNNPLGIIYVDILCVFANNIDYVSIGLRIKTKQKTLL